MLLEFLHSWGGGEWKRGPQGWSRLEPSERRLSATVFCALSKLLASLPLVLRDGSRILASAGGLSSPALIPQSNQSTDRKKKKRKTSDPVPRLMPSYWLVG